MVIRVLMAIIFCVIFITGNVSAEELNNPEVTSPVENDFQIATGTMAS